MTWPAAFFLSIITLASFGFLAFLVWVLEKPRR